MKQSNLNDQQSCTTADTPKKRLSNTSTTTGPFDSPMPKLQHDATIIFEAEEPQETMSRSHLNIKINDDINRPKLDVPKDDRFSQTAF